MNVVIVESAAKAKTINKYLGSGYKVIASFGHVRDLPAKNGSVEPDKDFEMHWDVDPKSQKIMKEIADAVKKADKLILATDPDREGEAISWHILQILEQKKALRKDTLVERVAFNAVTKQAILTALSEPRQIDGPLVSAYLARRALDYLVGFTLSPVLWRKLPGARSAGRVQSVALRLVCDREAEIEAFRTDEYWTIDAVMATGKGEEFAARLNAIDGTNLKKLDIKTGDVAHAIKAAIEKGDFRIVSVDKKGVKRNPYAPFATSTLQMDASRKLGFSAKQTMQVAQRLYEGVDIGGETVGLITYMRTDGVTIVPEAISAIRGLIAREYSQRFVAPFIREYKTKAKNAQEAHEAIRPTEVSRKPSDVAKYLEKDQARLYELIWKRAVASQMASAEVEQTTADIEVKGRDGKTYTLRATGSVIQFEGFLKVYEEGRDERLHAAKGKDDVTPDEDDASRRLPVLSQGDKVTDRSIEAEQHFTQPPPRFSEATLVKKMEELGIGRPSTYASTLAVLQERQYVRTDKKRLIPEDKGSVWSSPSSRASSSATSSTISPPTSRRSSTSSPTASSPGRTCCATSGASSPARSTTSRICASARCWKPSTRSWARTSSHRARTAPTRARVRRARPGGSASRSRASTAPSSAAATTPSAAIHASSATSATAMARPSAPTANSSASTPTAALP